MEIKIGYAIAKPVETQAQCDAYTAMVEAVNAHNAACAVGDTLWSIADKPGCYEVTDGGVKPDPEDQPEPEPVQRYIRYTAEELAAQEEAHKKAEAREKLPERVDALETANDDIILMMADLIGG